MKLLFVYNANNDSMSAAVDYAHKVFKPSTYRCDLCQLTYHNLGQRSAWKDFRKRAKVEIEFWYIRQFEQKFGTGHEYPVIFSEKDGELAVFMDRNELKTLDAVEDLIRILDARITQEIHP